MSEFDIIRAWKDPKYRKSLSQEELDRLPVNPAGLVELSEQALHGVTGMNDGVEPQATAWTCLIVSIVSAVFGCPTIGNTQCSDSYPCGTCRAGTDGCC